MSILRTLPTPGRGRLRAAVRALRPTIVAIAMFAAAFQLTTTSGHDGAGSAERASAASTFGGGGGKGGGGKGGSKGSKSKGSKDGVSRRDRNRYKAQKKPGELVHGAGRGIGGKQQQQRVPAGKKAGALSGRRAGSSSSARTLSLTTVELSALTASGNRQASSGSTTRWLQIEYVNMPKAAPPGGGGGAGVGGVGRAPAAVARAAKAPALPPRPGAGAPKPRAVGHLDPANNANNANNAPPPSRPRQLQRGAAAPQQLRQLPFDNAALAKGGGNNIGLAGIALQPMAKAKNDNWLPQASVRSSDSSASSSRKGSRPSISAPVARSSGDRRASPQLRPSPAVDSRTSLGNVEFQVVRQLGQGTFGVTFQVRTVVPEPMQGKIRPVDCVLKDAKVLGEARRHAPRELHNIQNDAERNARLDSWGRNALRDPAFVKSCTDRIERQMRNEFLAQKQAFQASKRSFARPIIQQDNHLLMEQVRGPTAKAIGRSLEAMREGQRITPLEHVAVVQHLSRQLMDAAHSLSCANVVHRDLSNNNILISPRGEVKVIDFGAAKPRGVTDAQIMAQGTAFGTSGFRSDNFIRSGQRGAGVASKHTDDVFSVGRNMLFLASPKGWEKVKNGQSDVEAVLREVGMTGHGLGRAILSATTTSVGNGQVVNNASVTASEALHGSFLAGHVKLNVTEARIAEILREAASQ